MGAAVRFWMLDVVYESRQILGIEIDLLARSVILWRQPGDNVASVRGLYGVSHDLSLISLSLGFMTTRLKHACDLFLGFRDG